MPAVGRDLRSRGKRSENRGRRCVSPAAGLRCATGVGSGRRRNRAFADRSGRTTRGTSSRLIRAGRLSFGSVVGLTAEGAEGRGGFEPVDQQPWPKRRIYLHGGVDDLSADRIDVPHSQSPAIRRGLRGLLFGAWQNSPRTPTWIVEHPIARACANGAAPMRIPLARPQFINESLHAVTVADEGSMRGSGSAVLARI